MKNNEDCSCVHTRMCVRCGPLDNCRNHSSGEDVDFSRVVIHVNIYMYIYIYIYNVAHFPCNYITYIKFNTKLLHDVIY